MKPKDKAKELVEKFQGAISDMGAYPFETKQCALICVEEIIKTLWEAPEKWEYKEPLWSYFKKVKFEIEKL